MWRARTRGPSASNRRAPAVTRPARAMRQRARSHNRMPVIRPTHVGDACFDAGEQRPQRRFRASSAEGPHRPGPDAGLPQLDGATPRRKACQRARNSSTRRSNRRGIDPPGVATRCAVPTLTPSSAEWCGAGEVAFHDYGRLLRPLLLEGALAARTGSTGLSLLATSSAGAEPPRATPRTPPPHIRARAGRRPRLAAHVRFARSRVGRIAGRNGRPGSSRERSRNRPGVRRYHRRRPREGRRQARRGRVR